MKLQYCLAVIACLLGAPASLAIAKSVTISIPMSNVSTRSGDRGNYHVVRFDVPADLNGTRLDSAFLEFVVDVHSTDAVDVGKAPIVSVFALAEEFRGSNVAFNGDGPNSQAVPLGESRSVTMDVAEIVRDWLAAPSANHGLVIGTLKGPDVGTVSLKGDGLGPGVAVRVTFFYQNRFGGRVPTK